MTRTKVCIEGELGVWETGSLGWVAAIILPGTHMGIHGISPEVRGTHEEAQKDLDEWAAQYALRENPPPEPPPEDDESSPDPR